MQSENLSKQLLLPLKKGLGKVLPHPLKYRLKKLYWSLKPTREDMSLHNFSHEQQCLDPSDPTSVAFHELGSWFTQFEYQGKKYGGGSSYNGDVRIQDYFQWVNPQGRVGELGSFEGGHTQLLAAHPKIESILGLEGRDFLIAKSEFIAKLFGLNQVSFKRCDFEIDSLKKFGQFDSLFCSGVLYHLTRPWLLIREMAKVSSHVFVSTHFSETDDDARNGFRGRVYPEFGYGEPLSGLDNHSFWLSRESLRLAFTQAGLEIREWKEYEWPNGPLVNIYASRILT